MKAESPKILHSPAVSLKAGVYPVVAGTRLCNLDLVITGAADLKVQSSRRGDLDSQDLKGLIG